MQELCKLKKNELNIHFKKILKIVKKPNFICEKCARVAKDKKYLCNPTAFKK
jgi:protein-arginine kinase activator protein McsA